MLAVRDEKGFHGNLPARYNACLTRKPNERAVLALSRRRPFKAFVVEWSVGNAFPWIIPKLWRCGGASPCSSARKAPFTSWKAIRSVAHRQEGCRVGLELGN